MNMKIYDLAVAGKTNPIKPHPNLSAKLFPLGDGQAIDPEDSKVFQAFIVA